VRIGVVSDTHGDWARLWRAVEEMGPVDMLLHAGDNYEDAIRVAATRRLKVGAVVGNCDCHVGGPREKIVEVAGKRILLTHGDQHGVKRDHLRLYLHARELGVHTVVFGHTHRAMINWHRGLLMFNPGSTHSPLRGRGTYGLLDVVNGRIEAEIRELGDVKAQAER